MNHIRGGLRQSDGRSDSGDGRLIIRNTFPLPKTLSHPEGPPLYRSDAHFVLGLLPQCHRCSSMEPMRGLT